jgi:hypothetical protein
MKLRPVIGENHRLPPLFPLWMSLFILLISATQSNAASRTTSPPKVIAIYFNEGRVLIELNLISKDGKEGTIIPLLPGRIERVAISEGKTKVYIPSEQMATRRLLSTSTTPTPKSAAEFSERETRSFYLRVVGGKVILVKPRDLSADERMRLEGYKRELQRAGVYNN